MEKYIITFESGETYYLSEPLKESDYRAFDDGIITIVRLSDICELSTDRTWTPLTKWEH